MQCHARDSKGVKGLEHLAMPAGMHGSATAAHSKHTMCCRCWEVSDLEVVLAGVATDLRAATMAELLFSRLCSCCSSPPSCMIPWHCMQKLSKKLWTHSPSIKLIWETFAMYPEATCYVPSTDWDLQWILTTPALSARDCKYPTAAPGAAQEIQILHCHASHQHGD